ncbi:adenylylsulfate kinase [Magnetococcus marinus MC-1]|uniref:Adenylylsulfate kinase n=1 Tax=Magnetococcus marinus (strain ATCC BAA-1437 / JCM 17883 / MC-1) TaxID=156889 RepID=A0LAQ6_MAGMM|nr:adenylyl-sulfate kinase [Magnetococcus marinus]ABK45049.1 adenylylsulfate kinase [Magnetococcus marinus MC-1]
MGNENRSGVIWITGYSASGKTTVARLLDANLSQAGVQTIFLDGDQLRSIFDHRWGYERADRIDLARVYFRLCSHLSSQGYTVIIAAVAMYEEVRTWFKMHVNNPLEIYLDVPESERRKRDKKSKHVYKKQDFKSLYDEPLNPDLVVLNHGATTPLQAAETIGHFYLYGEQPQIESQHGRGEHWNTYYRQAAAPEEPSLFAQEVAKALSPSSVLLEVGCGNGRDANYFARLGHKTMAIDASEQAIALCKESAITDNPTFSARRAKGLSATHINSFSAIYSRFCIHAMTKQEEVDFLNEAILLLEPMGRLYIECRSINDPLAQQGEVISPSERISGHYRRFIVMEELVNRLQQAGFTILQQQESQGFAPHKDEDPVVIRIEAEKPLKETP